MFKLTLVFFAMIFTVFVGCSGNVLSGFASTDTDAALIYQAKQAINAQNYQEAINIITLQVSSSGQTLVEARETLASAYAGKCGLNFINYTESLSNAVGGSAFQLMSFPFIGETVDPDSCLLSAQTMDLIGPTVSRNIDQNTFTAIVGMVMLGSATRQYTDDNPIGGDGTQDAPNISCGLTNSQIDKIVLGYAYVAQNFTALSSSVLGSTSYDAISDSIAICEAVAGVSCTNTDPNNVSNNVRNTLKDLLNTLDYGVGLASGANPIAVALACP
jgi:hypothetical protein